MVSIYDTAMQEVFDRKAYLGEIYAPYYICSYAMHTFNLRNQDAEIYWAGKQLPNMRLHILFVAPPGYMKTWYIMMMGGDAWGVFRNAGVELRFEQSLSEAGFVGTIQNVNGIGIPTEGAAQTNKDGLMLIDEFSAITEAMKSQMNAQLATQLLAALDSGYVYKRLSGGKLEYKTNMTLWAGVQPERYDLSAGLGRRLCFLVFLPTKEDNANLRRAMHEARNMRPNKDAVEKIWERIRRYKDECNKIEKIEFGEDVYKKYENLDLFSYETSYFDRILMGYHLAKFGPDRKMEIDMQDKDLIRIIDQEKTWRDDIALGVDYVQMLRIIGRYGGSVDRMALIKDCLMVGWNARQVFDKIKEMQMFGLIKTRNGKVEVAMPMDTPGV